MVIPRGGRGSIEIRAEAVAPYANGSCVATQGGTVVFASAVWRGATTTTTEGMVPLTVDYRHRAGANGRIPGNPRRREMPRGSEAELLASRAVDRALRPRFSKDVALDHVVVTTTVEADDEIYDPISLATNAASCAIALSGIPWYGPVGCSRVGFHNRRFVVDPTLDVLQTGGLDLLVATADEKNVIALELGCKLGWKDDDIIDAIRIAANDAALLVQAQTALVQSSIPPPPPASPSTQMSLFSPGSEEDQRKRAELERVVDRAHGDDFRDLFSGTWRSPEDTGDVDLASKQTRGALQQALFAEAAADATFEAEDTSDVWRAVEASAERGFERAAVEVGRRVDGRLLDEVRPIVARADIFPEGGPHGSGDLARGETRVMATCALDAPPRIRRLQWDDDGDGPRKEHEAFRRTVPAARRIKGVVARHTGDEDPVSDMSAAFEPRTGTTEFAGGAPLSDEDEEEDDDDEDDDAPVSEKKLEAAKRKRSKWVTQKRESLLDAPRRFCLHYEFPASATGRVDASSERRAVGHGALAERAVAAVFPEFSKFPYTARVAATVLASSGSTSMATVCAASLALYDAGVPLHSAVAGISIGLAGSKTLLVDLNGTEDHFGDMDFKIAGSRDSVTAAQLDVKLVEGVPIDILRDALEKARTARCLLLDAMALARVRVDPPLPKKVNTRGTVLQSTNEFMVLVDDKATGVPTKKTFPLKEPRREPKAHAPRVERLIFERDRLPDLVGPRGRTLRDIENRYRCAVETAIDGEAIIFALDKFDARAARAHVAEIVADIQVGDKLHGVVTDVREFGALVKLLRNREGLLHISEFDGHPDNREDLQVGDSVEVTCIGIDALLGSLKLSRKKFSSSSGSKS